MIRRGILLGTLAVSGCAPGGSNEALQDTLEAERRAHMDTDATLLASLVDDSMLVVQGGAIVVQSRSQVEATFRAYFDGAHYVRWDDLEPPRTHISDDGETAWVSRRVEVHRSRERYGEPLPESFESSWVATYRWDGQSWRMTSNASGLSDPAQLIVATGATRIGERQVVSNVQQIDFRAQVTGPRGGFTVEVRSARDGRANIAFGAGPTLGIQADRGWKIIGEGAEVEPITLAEHLFVRGHELLMSAVAPQTRFPPLRYTGQTILDGVPALRLSGHDAAGGAVDVFYSTADTVFLGYRVEDHFAGRGPVAVMLNDWRVVDDIRLPHRASFVQGAERFLYDLEAVSVLERADDEALKEPSSD